MEPEFRDQAALDHRLRHWRQFTEPEQGALLLNLSASLRTRLQYVELDQSLISKYRAFAHAAQEAGRALLDRARLPFDPDPPFRWSKMPLEEVNQRIGEIREWAEDRGFARAGHAPADHDKALHDLSVAGRTLGDELNRYRTR